MGVFSGWAALSVALEGVSVMAVSITWVPDLVEGAALFVAILIFLVVVLVGSDFLQGR